MQTWSAKLAEPSKSCARQKKLCRPLVFYTSLMSLTNFHPKNEDKRRIATTSQQPTFHSTHSTYPFLTTPRCPRYLEGGMCTALTARCTPVTVAVFLWAKVAARAPDLKVRFQQCLPLIMRSLKLKAQNQSTFPTHMAWQLKYSTIPLSSKQDHHSRPRASPHLHPSVTARQMTLENSKGIYRLQDLPILREYFCQ